MVRRIIIVAVAALLAALPASANKVTVREDHTLLIDGQPFFPVGLYYTEEEIADESGALLKGLREMGFNTIFFMADASEAATRAKLDRIAAAGLHVQFRPPGQLQFQFDDLRKAVAAYKDHPAMLFWEHGDEPLVNGTKFEQCAPGYKLMKQLDPDHPVLMVEYPYWNREAELKRFATICDVYAFDKYPVPLKRWFFQGKEIPHGWPHSIAIMGEVTAWWQTLAPGKPVVSILQAWNRKPREDGMAGYPTTAQSRFMAYQCVIRGAKGILYYGKIRVKAPHTASGIPYEIDKDPAIAARDFKQAREMNDAFWGELRKVVKEVGVMTPVFAAPDADWTPPVEILDAEGVKPSDIQLRVKQHDGAAVLMIVNASIHAARVRLSAPRVERLTARQDSPALVNDGKGVWTLTLEPYAVGVYSDRAKP